jgi:hypothetical protein
MKWTKQIYFTNFPTPFCCTSLLYQADMGESLIQCPPRDAICARIFNEVRNCTGCSDKEDGMLGKVVNIGTCVGFEINNDERNQYCVGATLFSVALNELGSLSANISSI